MRSAKGKVIAIGIVLPGILLLLAAAIVFRSHLISEWHIRRLRSEDKEVRRTAVERLGKLGSARAIPHLVAFIRESLESRTPEPARLTSSIANFVAVDDLGAEILFEPAVRSLMNLGPAAVSSLLADQEDWDAGARILVVDLLKADPPLLEELLPFLHESLRSHDPRARAEAARILPGVAAPAKERASLYLEALGDPVAAVRLYAARALSRIKPIDAAAIPPLIESLGDSEWEVRDLAAMLLASFEREAIPALLAALAKPGAGRDDEFHLMAIWSLGSIGPAAQGAAPALAGLLDDPRAGARCQAAMALGKIGPAAAGAAPALERRLEDADADVRRFAAEALKKILDP